MGIANRRGRAGEALAAAYLELVGCEAIARNVRLGGVEVDLVAVDGDTRVVVEVKTRNRTDYGGAVGALDHVKRSRLARAAIALGREGAAVRIDVVTVELSADGASIRHYRNAIVDGG